MWKSCLLLFLMLEFLLQEHNLLFQFQLNKYPSAPVEAKNTPMIKLAWRHVLPPERDVCRLLAGAEGGATAGTPCVFLERGTESLRVTAHDVMLFLRAWSPFPVSSLKGTFNSWHSNVQGESWILCVLYLGFKFKFLAIYSKPGNN